MCSNLSPFSSGSSRLPSKARSPKVGRTRLATHPSIILIYTSIIAVFLTIWNPIVLIHCASPFSSQLNIRPSVSLPTLATADSPPPSKGLPQQFLYTDTRGWSIHQPDSSKPIIVVGLMVSSLYTCPSVPRHESPSRPLPHTSSGLMQSLV